MASFIATPAIFTREFVSAQQSITAGALRTIAHGLGVTPKLVFPFLVCLVTQHGYGVGDVFQVNDMINSDGTDASMGQSITYDTTNIYVRFGSNGVCVYDALNKTTGAQAQLTNANFALIVKAYA